MRKFLVIAFAITTTFFILPRATHAKILSETYNRTYTIVDDYVEVKEVLTSKISNPNYLIPAGSEDVFVVFNPILDDPTAREKIDKTLPTISVKNAKGKKVAFTTEIEDKQHILVKVKRKNPLFYGQSDKLMVTYKSYAMTSRNGGLLDIYVPSFAKKFNFVTNTTTRTFNTKVIIPQSLGEINFVIPDKPAQKKGTNYILNFTQKDLTNTISWIQVGTKQYFKFEIKQPYSSTTNIPLFYNHFEILLPRDINSGPITQTLKFTEISPEPDSVETDENGNLVAKFAVPANSNGEIIVKGYSTLEKNKQINVKNSGTTEDIKVDILEANTKPGTFWESNDPIIAEAALEIKGKETNIYKIVAKTYQYVVDKIDYSNVKRFGLNERQGALQTFQGGAAVCMEYSDLFIALSRAQGIPARAAFGYGYDARSTNGDQTAHQWAEVYIPSLDEWIGVDTTWGESGPAIIGGDLNHFYKFVASIDPQTPAPVSLSFFGNTPEISQEQFTIEAINSIPSEADNSLSQDELLALYTPRSSLETTILNFQRGLLLGVNTVDNSIDLFLTNQLGMGEMVSAGMRILIYAAPFAIISLLLLRYRRNRK